jgi:3-oxoadipate CoA-transferase alpha subunit
MPATPTPGSPRCLPRSACARSSARFRARPTRGCSYTPTGYGTQLAEGKETRKIDGRNYVLEYPIHADYALIKADRADRWGNLVYRKTARNFGPIMASAARCTIVQVRETVDLGGLDPESIVTPGIFVHRIVRVPASALAEPQAAG